MIRIFRRYVPGSLLVLAAIEASVLFMAVYAGLLFRWAEVTGEEVVLVRFLPEVAVYVGVVFLVMFSLGLYQKEHFQNLETTFVRIIFSFIFGFFALSVVFYAYPPLAIWRSVFAVAFVVSIVGILLARYLFLRVADLDALKRRILVLGAGERAAQIEALERDSKAPSFLCVGFVPFPDEAAIVDSHRTLSERRVLSETARARRVEEIVVAIADRRGHLPVDSLLASRLTGIAVTEFATFWERETGRVDLATLTPSWLIFSEGFVGGRLQAAIKRLFDLSSSFLLLVLSLPILFVAAILVRVDSPGPVLYRQERVGLNGKTFMLLKFRSMRVDAEEDGVPQWAKSGDDRVTRIGRFIRKTRIDELPQIFNVLRGDMSFIGPRPERPFFVEQLSREIAYYNERHRVKPGISGWAQLHYPYGASVEDARQKFQYDLYYIKNYSIFLDVIVLIQTVRVILWPHGVR